MSKIAVLDLGAGNLHSVGKALECVAPDHQVLITENSKVILDCEHVVIPGQGAIGSWFQCLEKLALFDIVEAVLESRPVLGICLGLQALYGFSEEDGGVDGFGWLSGRVKRFPIEHGDSQRKLKVPHIGWNNVQQVAPHPLWRNIPNNARFYFVHSYYAESNELIEVSGRTHYGLSFVSAATRSNVLAVQFHPEKSHAQGLNFLRNFVSWDGS